MFEDNGWALEFSSLIDISVYFDNHFVWEQMLSETLKQYLSDNKKNFEFDFKFDRLIIMFDKQEINDVIQRYNSETVNRMDHFVKLLQDYTFSREYNSKRKYRLS